MCASTPIGSLVLGYGDWMVPFRPWAMAAAVLGLVTVGIYVTVLSSEGSHSVWQVAPWAGMMLAASGLALAGGVTHHRMLAKGALLTAIVLFAVLGFLALFSIGFLLASAAGLAAVAFAQVARDEQAPAL